jgi:hypothetical protein
VKVIAIILKEILRLLWNESGKAVTASVAPIVARSMRDAWKQRMLDKWKKSRLYPNK